MKKALIIDDNKMFRDSLEVMLDELKFEVLAFSSPDKVPEGLDHCDIVMCDLLMPTDFKGEGLDSDEEELDDQSVMVGVHALKEFSAKYPQAAVIAMSGFVEPHILRSMSTFGARVTLKKPFDLSELESALNRAQAEQNGASL